MAANLLTPQGPMPGQAAPAFDAVRPALPGAAKVGGRRDEPSGRSFADELVKPQTAAGPSPAAAPTKPAEPQDADPAKKAVQILKKTPLSTKQDVDKAPAVALLTGRLDRLSPSQIPALVSGNKFINDALSSDDLPDFLNKPAAVTDLVKDLNLPPQLLQQAQALGLDLSQKLTPNDFLKALGVDAGQVAAELTQLKANLPLDGLAPYLSRAAALQTQAPKPELNGQGALAPNPSRLNQYLFTKPDNLKTLDPSLLAADDLDPIGFAWVASPNKPSLTPLPNEALTGSAPSLAGLNLNKPDDLSPQALAAALQGAAMPRARVDGLTAKPVEVGAERTTAAFVGVANSGPGGIDIDALIARANPDGSLDLLAVENTPLNSPDEAAKPAPKLNKASFDAFALLGDKMRSSDTAVLNAAAPDERLQPRGEDPALSEQLLRGNFSLNRRPALVGSAPRLEEPGAVLMQVKTTEVTTLLPLNGAPQPRLDAIDQRLLLDDMMDGGGFIVLHVAPKTALAIDHSALYSVPDLRLSSPLAAATPLPFSGGQGRGDQPGDEADQQMGQGKNQQKLAADLRAVPGRQPTASSFAAHTTTVQVAEPALNMQARLDLMQKVMNHATVLAKQGGGSVRLDLSSPELGPLELALNMNKDKLDLRVLTGSDRARDAIMADLNQLKGTLSVQNVQLGKVEVGVGGRQPQNAFAGQGQQGGGQSFSNRGQDDGRSQYAAPMVSRIAAPRSRLALAMQQNQTIDNGRIAVRA